MESNKKRTILHCDLNSYFASVELLYHPELLGKPVAVCGSVEERHGIVLAKTEEAKRFGVRTGEAIWEAKQKCPFLVTVPPSYGKYAAFSRTVKQIYYQYTDMVESFGIDEAWLDVTASENLFGDGLTIADTLRERVKRETGGLTISVGVSFCKTFAKLGSDLKKPDAVTHIPYDSFRRIVWPLSASEMLGVGPSTSKKLASYGIHTIGQIANYPLEFFEHNFGVNGSVLWMNANGMDNAPVARYTDVIPAKSVGHGNTTYADLTTNNEVRLMFIELAQDVSHRLRQYKLNARRIQISVRDNAMNTREYQTPLSYPTQCWKEISDAAYGLFCANYDWIKPIRALSVRGISLESEDTPYQTDIFCDTEKHERIDSLERAIESLRERYGRSSLEIAALMQNKKIPIESSFEVQNHFFH